MQRKYSSVIVVEDGATDAAEGAGKLPRDLWTGETMRKWKEGKQKKLFLRIFIGCQRERKKVLRNINRINSENFSV